MNQAEQKLYDFVEAHPDVNGWTGHDMDAWSAMEADWQAAAKTDVSLVPDKAKLMTAFEEHPIKGRRITTPDPIGGRAATRDNGGFKSYGEFLRVLSSQQYDPRIARCQQMAVTAGITINASGGALVPEMYAVDDRLNPGTEAEIMRPAADVRVMTGGSLHISGLENLSAASGIHYGGFQIQSVPEGDEFNLQTPATAKVILTRSKMGIATDATWELTSDSEYERLLVPALNGAIAYGRDYLFLRGTGSGQPRGVLNAPSTISVAKESGQAAATIVYENVTKMFARMHPECASRAVWVASITTIPQLLKLSIPIGTGGSAVPVLNESNGTFTMLGRPVLFTSKLPTLGTVGDLMFIDRSQYVIGETPGIFVASSDHVKFLEGKRVWLAFIRIDGQPKWKSAFTPQNGDSLSWAVTLATRA